MTSKTSLDLTFIDSMTEVQGIKAHLHQLLATHRKPDSLPMILEGLRNVRTTRRAFIAKYRELKTEESGLPLDDPRRL